MDKLKIEAIETVLLKLVERVDKIEQRLNHRTSHRVYQASIKINGFRVALGSYKSKDERDQAVQLAKIGVYPEGLEHKIQTMLAAHKKRLSVLKGKVGIEAPLTPHLDMLMAEAGIEE